MVMGFPFYFQLYPKLFTFTSLHVTLLTSYSRKKERKANFRYFFLPNIRGNFSYKDKHCNQFVNL